MNNLIQLKSPIILSLLLFSLSWLTAQTNDLDKFPVEVSPDNLTLREIGYMAVFPGCDKIDVNDKSALQSCLSQELNRLLGENLSNKLYNDLEKNGYTNAVAKLMFVIDKSGEIVQVKAMSGGNPILNEASVEAMNKISKKIKKIQPATLDDGTPVNLVFQLPVKYKIQDSKLNEFKWSEIVIATLKKENQKFEIRENQKESIFKVYEIKNEESLFLGNFKSFNDVLILEPYKSMYQSEGSKILLSESETDEVLYRIYYSTTQEKFVEVFKVINNSEELVESLPLSDLQYSSLYLKMVLRE